MKNIKNIGIIATLAIGIPFTAVCMEQEMQPQTISLQSLPTDLLTYILGPIALEQSKNNIDVIAHDLHIIGCSNKKMRERIHHLGVTINLLNQLPPSHAIDLAVRMRHIPFMQNEKISTCITEQMDVIAIQDPSRPTVLATSILNATRINTTLNITFRNANTCIALLEKLPYTANKSIVTACLWSLTFFQETKPLLSWCDNENKKLNGCDDLVNAIKSKDHKTVKELLKNKNIDLDGKNHQDVPLTIAARNNDTEMVKILLDAGAYPSPYTHNNDIKAMTNIMMDAAYQGNVEIVKLLLETKVNVNFLNAQRENALMHAIHSGKEDIVQILLDAHSDPNAKNRHDKTAADLAREAGHTKIAAMLDEASQRKRSLFSFKKKENDNETSHAKRVKH